MLDPQPVSRPFDRLFSQYADRIWKIANDPLFAETREQCLKSVPQAAAAPPLDEERWRQRVAHYCAQLPARFDDEEDQALPAAALLAQRSRSQQKFLFGIAGRDGAVSENLPFHVPVKQERSSDGKDAKITLSEMRTFETLLALHIGGVLAGLLAAKDRPLIWQIGAGDGSLSCALRSTVPQAAIIVSDTAANFPLAATTLKMAFPSARIFVFDPATPPDAGIWDRFDIFFVPPAAAGDLFPLRPDLTFSHLALQRMPLDVATSLMSRACKLGSPFLYDFRLSTQHPHQAEGGLGAEPWPFEAQYWPHVMPLHMVLPGQVTLAMDAVAAELGSTEGLSSDFSRQGSQHVIGWRRMLP
jgi:hypothetical protein